MPSTVLIDTGIWYALFDKRDYNRLQHKDDFDALVELLNDSTVLLPWPSVYEIVCTRFARNRLAMIEFELHLSKKKRVEFIDDAGIRKEALGVAFDSSIRHRRPLSHVDCILRMLIDDRSVRMDAFATLNPGDFADVCASRHIPILPSLT